MACLRATNARKLLDAVEILDSYGWTGTAVAVAACAQDVIDGKIDPAPKAD